MAERFFYGFEAGEVEDRLRKVVSTPDASRPAIYKLNDAVALPGLPGLYDTSGRRIEEAAVRMISHGAPPILREKLYKGDRGQVCIPERLEPVHETMLFGGHLMKHYGHFIIESMSRLWARHLFPTLPILFTSPGKWRQPPAYGTDVIAALDLTPRTLRVDKPTIFREVVCPGTAIEYRWKAYSVADEPHTAVAEALDGTSQRTWRRPVYLTRSALSDDLRKSDAEPELEAQLSSRGFDVVRPEMLSLREQISLFEQAPLIVGMVGSALHTALFSRSSGTLAILNWGRGFEHYLLVDGVKRHRSYYIKSMQRHGEAGEYVMDVGRTLQLLEQAGLLAARTRLGIGG
ncbi:MAG: glycosyltransferase family 61 protein [Sphingomonas sp.]|nr:glycosyltransferase family 61 protein [Sphingomonas sp.]